MIFLLLALLVLAVWLSPAWSADVTPAPSVPEHPQTPSTPPPSHIDPGIERRPQTVPDPHSAVVPPKVDPKMAIDPEKAPPASEKTKPSGPHEPPTEPSNR